MAPVRTRTCDNPLGVGGRRCTNGSSPRARSSEMFGQDGGTTGIDDDFAARGFDEHRRLDHGPQHVRTGARDLARRDLEGLVGRQSAVSHAPSSCSPTTRARRSPWTAARRSISSRTASMPRLSVRNGCRRRPRRPAWRRRCHDPAISARRADRRDASRDRPRCCSAPANTCLRGSTLRSSAIDAPSTFRPRTSRMPS